MEFVFGSVHVFLITILSSIHVNSYFFPTFSQNRVALFNINTHFKSDLYTTKSSNNIELQRRKIRFANLNKTFWAGCVFIYFSRVP